MDKHHTLLTFLLFCIVCVMLLGTQDLQNELDRTRIELDKFKTDSNHVVKPIVNNDSLEKEIDSLSNELFQKSTELDRCQMSLDYLNDINPKAYKQYELFYETQTE